MKSYAFSPPFVAQIRSGHMTQTFCLPRLRGHARPGEVIQLVDTVNARAIIPDPICVSSERCEIVWKGNRIASIRVGNVPILHLDKLAAACGYADFAGLETDFLRRYKPVYLEGFLIEWADPALPAMAEAA